MRSYHERSKKISIQETYGDRFQHCWGCGPKNDMGLHLKSYPSEDKKTVRTKIIPDEIYTGGVTQNLFGGMIAMIFDCHGKASAAYFAHIDKGLEFDDNTIIGRFITARLEVDFKKSTPMNEEIEMIAKLEELGERKAIINMELLAKNEIRAKAKMVAVAVKDNM
ncbi:thioesterase [Anaerococcus ihuae]|uniref:thioesterase n=1 Tax=Anaerococcus ihuae TaxID=2899519 RepID=UPI001F21747F|nr:thioesterase [Anaerococcus ihuae]